MPGADEIKRTARQMLGRISWGGFREYKLLARLLEPDETIESMALGRRRDAGPIGAQRVIVATPRRLLLVDKGFLTGRERIEELDWSRVRGVSVQPPSRLSLETDAARLEFTFVQPPRQLGMLADLVRRRIDPSRAATIGAPELLDLARRKLGRLLGVGVEPHVLALAGELAPGEHPLELAFVTRDSNGLLVATASRLLYLPSRGMTGVGEAVSLEYGGLRRVALVEPDVLVASAADGEVRWNGVMPPDRALGLVEVASARCAAG